MIPAHKSLLFSKWFGWVAQRRIARTFGAVRVRGLASVAALVAARPVLVVSNHTSWWDPLVVLLSARLLRASVYAMMEANQLRALPFFARAGAFGVDPFDPRDGARAVRYAARLLDRPGRLLWLFPQGREAPMTARPLAFRAGSAQVARLAAAAVTVPAAVRYEHGPEERPVLYVSFAGPLPRVEGREHDLARGAAAQEAAVVVELDRIDRALVTGDLREFEEVHRAKPSRLFAAAQSALGVLLRPRRLG